MTEFPKLAQGHTRRLSSTLFPSFFFLGAQVYNISKRLRFHYTGSHTALRLNTLPIHITCVKREHPVSNSCQDLMRVVLFIMLVPHYPQGHRTDKWVYQVFPASEGRGIRLTVGPPGGDVSRELGMGYLIQGKSQL